MIEFIRQFPPVIQALIGTLFTWFLTMLGAGIVFFFKRMFIIPLIPSGLYFADGFVINSPLFTVEEGSCFNICAVDKFDGFPSINTRTFSFPLKLIVPD